MLVKYKSPEMIASDEYLIAVYHDNPSELLKTIKEVNTININDVCYTYCDSEFIPAKSEEYVDVLNVYVDYYEFE